MTSLVMRIMLLPSKVLHENRFYRSGGGCKKEETV